MDARRKTWTKDKIIKFFGLIIAKKSAVTLSTFVKNKVIPTPVLHEFSAAIPLIPAPKIATPLHWDSNPGKQRFKFSEVLK